MRSSFSSYLHRLIPLLLSLSLLLSACGDGRSSAASGPTTTPALTTVTTEPIVAIPASPTTTLNTVAVPVPTTVAPTTASITIAPTTQAAAPTALLSGAASGSILVLPTGPASVAPTPSASTLTPTAAATATPALSRFESARCPFKLAAGQTDGQNVSCGYLVVAEEHARPTGPTLRLAVAILKSSNPKPNGPPLVFLQGGPGGAVEEIIQSFASDQFPPRAWLGSRDVIIFDQRGVGYSQPSLTCTEVNDLAYKDLDKNISLKEGNDRAAAAMLACRDRLIGAGVNLAAYNSAESAADINDLRLALGYSSLDLYGVSYGTRLALTVMRDFPQALRSVILDSTVPLQSDLLVETPLYFDRSLNLVFQSCATNPQCSTTYPNLKETFSKAVTQLNANPVLLKVPDTATGKTYDVLVNGATFVSTLFDVLYVTSFLEAVPLIIGSVGAGRYDVLAQVLPFSLFRGNTVSRGMYFSVQCGEEFSFSNYEAVRSAAQNILPEIRDNFALPQDGIYAICRQWPSKKALSVENEPVKSDLPTLVLSGQYDPITPPSLGQLTAKNLSQSFYFEFPATGHGVVPSSACAVRVSEDFLQNPQQKPGTGCTSSLSLRYLLRR